MERVESPIEPARIPRTRFRRWRVFSCRSTESCTIAALDTFANGLVLGKEVLHRICGCADGLGDRPGEPAQDEPRETEHTLRRERVAERSPDPHDLDYRRAAEATGPPRLRVSCGLPGGVSAERGLFEHLEY